MKSYFLEAYSEFKKQRDLYPYIPDLGTRAKAMPETEVLWIAGGTGMGRAFDFFAVCRDKKGLYYVANPDTYSIRWTPHYVTIEKLREYITNKVALYIPSRNEYDGKSVVYWWRAELKEFCDELESEERGRVSEGPVGVVQEA